MILNFFEKLLCPLALHTPEKRTPSDIEKYILSHNPQSLADVERLQKQYASDKQIYLPNRYRF